MEFIKVERNELIRLVGDLLIARSQISTKGEVNVPFSGEIVSYTMRDLILQYMINAGHPEILILEGRGNSQRCWLTYAVRH